MMSRDEMYQPEPVPGAPITREELTQLLRALPVPVIGVPWSAVTHVPDALALAHEVGHVVEEDLGLLATVNGAIAAVVGDAIRCEAWTSWAGELFADLFGVVAVGPSFVGLLADKLAADPGVIATEKQAIGCWGKYPTAHLRVACAAAAVDALDWGASVDAWRPQYTWWSSHYPTHAMAAFDGDVKAVVEAILCRNYTQLGGAGLKAVMGTPILMAKAASNALLDEGGSMQTDDARAVIAGAWLSFATAPASYEALKAHDRAIEHLDAYWEGRATARGAVGSDARDATDLLFNGLTKHWPKPPAA